MKRVVISLLCLWSVSVSAWSREIYVSPSGSDTAPGSRENPVATLQRALDLGKGSYGRDSVTIFLRQGTYRQSEPVVIGPDCSGTERFPVKIAAYPGEKAVITSSRALDCEWRPYEGDMLVADIPGGASLRFDRLFADGTLQTMARYPNRNPDVNIFEGYAPDAIAPERVARWMNPAGGYVHAMHSSEWGGYQYLIEGKEADGKLKLSAGFQNNRMAGMHPQFRMVENVFEELDAPGEWFFDAAGSRLYYIPAEGMDVNTVRFETPQSESLIEIRGEEGNPVQYVSITGLELGETTRTFLKTAEPLLRSDWKIYRGGAIYFENAENCSLTDCHLRDIGGNAVFFSGHNRHNSVRRNHIERVGASAVCFVGKPESVRAPLFEYGESQAWGDIDRTPGPCGDDYPAECDVTDNLIHSIGEVEKQGAGIQISMAMDITASHNSIYRLPRAGINISEGTWGGHVIEWNDVFDTVRETGDHGSFNSWGRDRFWHPDRGVMDSVTALYPHAAYVDAIHTTILRNNRWRCDHGWDVDLDDGSSNYHIYNNLCLNGGLKLREGFGRVVENNVMVNNSFHPHVWFDNGGDVFRYNIVTTDYQPVWVNTWGMQVDYNFFASPDDLEAARSNGTDLHSLAGDPMFVAPDEGDYRVAECSKALKAGFRNFPMDSFGVIHPPLRALAERPVLPVYRLNSAAVGVGDNDAFEWNGVRFKSVTTEGERSATGIASVTGVLVLANSNPEIDLRPNDVVLEIDDKPTDSAAILRRSLESLDGRQATVVRFRNQKPGRIAIPHSRR